MQMRDRRMVRAASSYGVGGGDSGSASVEGFSFSWCHNEAANIRRFTCRID
jgi:hypothetical protein